MNVYKKIKAIEEFLDEMLSDWSWNYDIGIDTDEPNYFHVSFDQDHLRDVDFKVDDSMNLYVDNFESSWNGIELDSNSVKWFWIAVLG